MKIKYLNSQKKYVLLCRASKNNLCHLNTQYWIGCKCFSVTPKRRKRLIKYFKQYYNNVKVYNIYLTYSGKK